MIAYLLILSMGFPPANEVEALREQYLSAALDKSRIEDLAESCATLKNPNAVVSRGYCTMIHFLEAKNAFNPYRKFAEFNTGKRLLDSLIQIQPKNIELRYLRHTIQDRVPGFLGYNENMKEDEEYMQVNLPAINDSSTYHLIYNYLNNRNR
ncbi:MAG: hypothetical protein ABJF04_03000 [Reichenbachiella sp.]|uniref:hypothetical protein n=1 Tax=Reichenbachiella sp. TaxID=2184521 RepID=UPI003267EC77